jgi:adhesin/invasin
MFERTRHSPGARAVTALALGAAALVVLGACSSDKNTGPSAPYVVDAFSVASASVTAGDSDVDSLTAYVTDENGAPVPNTVVAWAVTAGDGTVTAPTSTTNAGGLAAIGFVAGTTAGADVIAATDGSATAATFGVAVTAAAPASFVAVSGSGQAAAAGTELPAPCVVHVADPYGNPVAGVNVIWSATGGATLSADTTATDSTGTASEMVTLGAVAGVDTVTATVSGLTAVTFDETGN